MKKRTSHPPRKHSAGHLHATTRPALFDSHVVSRNVAAAQVQDTEKIARALRDYEDAVETLASEKISHLFRNSSPHHAAIVLTAMLKYAEEEMKIYDEDLTGDISDKNPSFYSELDNFVRSNKMLTVVVRNRTFMDCEDSESVSKIYLRLKDYTENYPNVKVCLASDEFKEAIHNVFDTDVNFALGDDQSYRLELAKDRHAVCDFNNKERGKKLNDAFVSTISSCNSFF